MTDRPILFSGPMIRALLAGRKTQTRRVLKEQPTIANVAMIGDRWQWRSWKTGCVLGDVAVPIAPGDRLWVKETWSHTGTGVWTTQDTLRAFDGHVIYRADGEKPFVGWFPSIFMFKQFSRLTLTVTDVRVQRLQDISEDDAMAEGAMNIEPALDVAAERGLPTTPARCGFRNIWNSINGPDAWAANPWVAAYTFDVHRCNIDRMPA